MGRVLLSFPRRVLAWAATLKKWLFVVSRLDSKGAKVCKSCRSRQELSKLIQTSVYYLLAKLCVDAAENGPLKVCQKITKFFKLSANFCETLRGPFSAVSKPIFASKYSLE